MSKIVSPETAATFEEVYRGGYDKSYPSLDLVRLEKWYFEGKPGLALDYGCGPGTNGLHLLDSGYEVVFADVAVGALAKVEGKLARRPDAAPRATVRLIDPNADDLPDPDATYDYVICLSVLGNLESEASIRHLLAEFARVLKPGGKMLVDINGEDSTFAHEGTKVAEGVYKTLPRKGFRSDEILMYFPGSAQAFAGMLKDVPGIVVDDVGYSAFAYQGYDGLEYIVCARKSG